VKRTVSGEFAIPGAPTSGDGYLLLLFLIGIFLPSSLGGNLSSLLIGLSYGIALFLLAYGGWKLGASGSVIIYCVLPILIILCFCTVFWSVGDIRVAKLGVYGASALMFSLRWRHSRLRYGNHILLAASAANIVMGLGILAHWSPITDFVNRFYAAFFDDLVLTMLALHKPVLTYGTHSLAAFFIYLFYWMNFRTFEATKSKINLVFAILHAALCAAMLSHTSFVFALLAFAEMGWYLVRHARYTAIAFVLVIAIGLPGVASRIDPDVRTWGDIGQVIRDVVVFTWTDKAGGLAGRFSAGGDMAAPIAYIADHPFSPIGVSTREGFILDDSGPIEYMIRGSVLLVLLMYGGAWYFLRAHLPKWAALRFFLCILAMEVGFSVLTYHRALFLLPACLIYLSSLEGTSTSDIARSQPIRAY
jgi:hypothetical protein